MINVEEELAQVEVELHEVEEDLALLLQRQSELLDRKKELQERLADDSTGIESVQGADRAPIDWKTQFPWTEQVQTLLKDTFHLPKFRSVQEEVINATLSKQDVFVVMRSGGGKSLCYQLPAMLDGDAGFTVVISPLISLIQDQVMLFNDIAGDGAAYKLSGEQSRGESSAIYKALLTPESTLKILLITPEKLIKSKLLMSSPLKATTRSLGELVVMVTQRVVCFERIAKPQKKRKRSPEIIEID
ncbi:hypothetical protein PHYBOEH_001993 [Phytophthora boehmeriae]|uniref:DNA 3'-5' helicase n=1 Tax=Phytophthora boehmeriae TaxID=109152 RepID=A0A8T1WXX3_9STRA|nr:hypothetical protein PHYBOEH_001993 [Phytophthora boehmeriae]